MAGRTQIIWLTSLLLGAAIIPAGIPAALYYFWKIRPVLDRIERGELDDLFGESLLPRDTPNPDN